MLIFSVNTSDSSFDRKGFDILWKEIVSFPGVTTLVLLHNP